MGTADLHRNNVRDTTAKLNDTLLSLDQKLQSHDCLPAISTALTAQSTLLERLTSTQQEILTAISALTETLKTHGHSSPSLIAIPQSRPIENHVRPGTSNLPVKESQKPTSASD